MIHLLHKWGPWINIKMTVRTALNNGPLQGTYTLYSEPFVADHQKKTCEVCGKKKVRRV